MWGAGRLLSAGAALLVVWIVIGQIIVFPVFSRLAFQILSRQFHQFLSSLFPKYSPLSLRSFADPSMHAAVTVGQLVPALSVEEEGAWLCPDRVTDFDEYVCAGVDPRVVSLVCCVVPLLPAPAPLTPRPVSAFAC
jgi:hypothetical protein